MRDIKSVILLGKKRTLLSPPKHRGGERIRRSFIDSNDDLSPHKIIDFIKLWTRHTREHAPARIKNDLFLVCNKWRGDGEWVRSFGETTNGRYQFIQAAVNAFFKPRMESWVGTRVLRASFADQIDLLLEGDLDALGVLLGHKSRSTTSGPYRAQKAQERDEYSSAGGMVMRERMVETNGQCDLRPLKSNINRAAATPGWECIDIFSSPIPGQINGRACSAYGRCPECPLGQRLRNESEALARYLQLKEVYQEAKEHLGAKQFALQYGKSEFALMNTHIPAIATEVNIRLAGILTLNPLPRIL